MNLDVTEVNMVVNGIPNKVFSQGTKGRNLWKEVYRRIEKENSAQSRKHEDSDLHDSGLRLVNTKEGVQLSRKGSVSGNVKCHIFILSVTQFIVANRELKSVT